MRPVLLDTNVISELRKGKYRIDANVLRWSQELDIESCYLSVITLFELERGILLLQKKDPKQAVGLARWFCDMRDREFKGRTLSIGVEIASRAASLQSENPKSLPDALIAATALERKLIIATRNTQDYLESGASVMNPWEPGSPVTVML